MTLEQLIDESRTRNNTHQSSLQLARARMAETNKRLGREFRQQTVTEELLNRVISL